MTHAISFGKVAAPALTLCERLRHETMAVHRALERSDLMQALLKGRMEPTLFCLMLRNLLPMYAALESGLSRNSRHPSIDPIYHDSLFRSRALATDLDALQGSAWRAELAILPVTEAYAESLMQLSASQPELLVAHAYVRYLGDLSGGQLIQNILARAPVAGRQGSEHRIMAFYDFGPPAEVGHKASLLRDGINRVGHDPALAQAIVDEALRAFELHRQLFEQLALAGQLPKSMLNPVH
jgi:heme oxygenase